jgi:hypothetical protein
LEATLISGARSAVRACEQSHLTIRVTP